MTLKFDMRFAYVAAANTLCAFFIQSIYVSCEPTSASIPDNCLYRETQSSFNESNNSGGCEKQEDLVEKNKWRQALANNTFPTGFWFGFVSSAYQVEGAWNIDGKGLSVWDVMTHSEPGLVTDRTNGDYAVDFYHKFEEDILNAKNTGATMFAISLSWTRLLPEGYTTKYNEKGIAYYHRVIDTIKKNGMEPMVTLFHWDLPCEFQKLGGIANPNFIDWFCDYAKFVFQTFGSKVKNWLTFSDCNTLCIDSYGYILLPAINQPGIADYLCGHNLILAHASVYRMYKREFYKEQKGRVGIAQSFAWYEPQNSSSKADVLAAENTYQWSNNWLTQPILGDGNYPKVMREEIGKKSKLQGFSRSRLPYFTRDERKLVQGSADFIGLIYRETAIARGAVEDVTIISIHSDANVKAEFMQPKNADTLGKLLRRLQSDHKNFRQFYIMYNSCRDTEGLGDWNKVENFKDHLTEVMRCMQEDVNVRGFLVWSLTDTFEWSQGYRDHFGLYQVNRYDGSFSRTARLSQKFIADVYQRRYIRSLPEIYGYNCTIL